MKAKEKKITLTNVLKINMLKIDKSWEKKWRLQKFIDRWIWNLKLSNKEIREYRWLQIINKFTVNREKTGDMWENS